MMDTVYYFIGFCIVWSAISAPVLLVVLRTWFSILKVPVAFKYYQKFKQKDSDINDRLKTSKDHWKLWLFCYRTHEYTLKKMTKI